MVSRTRCLAVVLAFAFAPSLAHAESDPVQPGAGEVLKLPGMPDIPMPPGVHVYGPRGGDPETDANGMMPGRPDGGMVVGPGGVIPTPGMPGLPPRRAAEAAAEPGRARRSDPQGPDAASAARLRPPPHAG